MQCCTIRSLRDILFLALITYLLRNLSLPATLPSPPQNQPTPRTFRVPVIPYNDTEFKHRSKDFGRPVISHLSFLTQWKAFDRWVLMKYIENHVPYIKGVIYEEGGQWWRDMCRYVGFMDDDVSVRIEPKMLFSGKKKVFTRINVDVRSDFREDIDPFDAIGDEEAHISIDFATSGVVLPVEMVKGDTYLVSMAQDLKIELFSPGEANNLYQYSFLDPMYSLSQVDLSNPKSGERNLKKLVKYEVVIQKGNLLYIPPMWFYRISFYSSNIVLSLRTESIETPFLDFRSFKDTLQHSPNNMNNYSVEVAYISTEYISERLDSRPKDYMRNLVYSRYNHKLTETRESNYICPNISSVPHDLEASVHKTIDNYFDQWNTLSPEKMTNLASNLMELFYFTAEKNPLSLMLCFLQT
eukprot:TRINITY_DN5498_c0_g1_i1.p1 TRINITY_DN5498_c0_g1~~TRINITY_DN5498_c0_g1_i1.p1  ORF type:complete len:411 (-),score=68.49 TRINITY_DN5498_c0_g1_i1:596-1828(-)